MIGGGQGEYLTFYNENLNNPHHRILRPIADIFINSKSNLTNSNANIMVHSKSNTTTGGFLKKPPNTAQTNGRSDTSWHIGLNNLKENENKEAQNTRQVVISTGKRDLMNHSAEIYETNDSVGLYPSTKRARGGGLMQEISRQFSEAICRKNKTQMGFHKP